MSAPKTPSNTLNAKPKALGKPLVSLSAAAVCFASAAYAQTSADSGLVVLPTVDVETTQAPAPQVSAPRASTTPTVTDAQRRAQAAAAAAAAARAEAAAAEARAQAEAAATAQRAEAARRAQAGANPYADPDAPLRASTISNSRVQGPLLETPRTVTVATEEYLDTTNTTSIRQLARSTPGVSLGFGEGGSSFGDNLYIRGFRANNDVYVDGVRDSGLAVRETFNSEQVEIVKGPSGSIAGRGTTGGALNIVTKRPQDVDFQQTTFEFTDAGTLRTTLDYNWAQSDQLQFRINGMLQDGEVAGRDDVYDDRQGLALAARYKVNDNITVDADYSYTKFDQMPDWGVGYITDPDGLGISEGPITESGVSRDTFYGIDGRDFQEFEQNTMSAKVTWDLNATTTLTNTLRGVSSVNDYIITAPSRVNDNGSTDVADWTVGTSVKSRYQETDVYSNTTEIAGKAAFLGYQHSYVAGVMLQSESLKRASYEDLQSEDFPIGESGCTLPALNPDPSRCWNGSSPVRGDFSTEVDVTTTSAYVTDRVTLSPRLIFDAGLRVDHYETTASGTSRGVDFDRERSDTMLNGNLGLTYKLQDNWTVYGAAGTSTNPMGQEIEAGGGSYGGLDANGELLDPERNTSLEIGTKYELNEHLLFTAALFQTTKHNGMETFDGVTDSTLEYRMSGIELGVAGRVADKWGLYGGAVFMQSEILDSLDDTLVGEQIATVVNEQFNLLATYDYDDRLMLGAQINWAGDVDLGTTAPNGNKLPSYMTVDLVASYDVSDNAAIRFGVKNASDETYYDTAYRSGEPFTYVAPGREIWAAIDVNF
ncbi:catecholate siderophore receptor [Loktanella ponticola]|uniref:Catecholate siderophore receptor n=1 Tax=Yoonia ponticola TaxID=1524255 RepID=A0A7W9BJK2_9RHOB|nr:TonB-dependent siderophore receptor [Yoonia ponticola]MBB5721427.1 catecholate siderophore receptor [Yoonia ponticola]